MFADADVCACVFVQKSVWFVCPLLWDMLHGINNTTPSEHAFTLTRPHHHPLLSHAKTISQVDHASTRPIIHFTHSSLSGYEVPASYLSMKEWITKVGCTRHVNFLWVVACCETLVTFLFFLLQYKWRCHSFCLVFWMFLLNGFHHLLFAVNICYRLHHGWDTVNTAANHPKVGYISKHKNRILNIIPRK